MEESDWEYNNDHLPIKPIIEGPSTGAPNKDYSYDFISADPDDDEIHFFIDMGDGEFDRWVGPFSSCEIKNILYYYEKSGTYTIRVKTRDSSGSGDETDWTTFKVTMPRNRPSASFSKNHLVLYNFLQKFLGVYFPSKC